MVKDWNESKGVCINRGIPNFFCAAAHDLVKEDNATSKEQQLQVLAGDYYSGRYYQVTSEC